MSFLPDILPPEAMLLSAGQNGDEPASGSAPAPEISADAGSRLPAVPAQRGEVALTVVLSIALHLAVAAFFLASPAGAAISRLLAGIQASGPAAAGNGEANQTAGSASASEEKPVLVTLVTPPRRPQPTPPSPVKQAEPQKVATPAEHPASQQQPPQEILAAKAPAPEKAAQPPAAEPPPKASRQEATAAPEPPPPSPQPPVTDTPPPAVPIPIARPAPPRPVRTAQNAPAPRGGKANAQRGIAGGSISGHAASTQSGRSKTGSGNAAVSNYPGEVTRQLHRSLRYPQRAAERNLRGETQVQFTVEASGKVGEVRVLTTSGSDILDQAAIETVRRAAPFPPIPSGADRHEWPFTVTLAFGK